MGQYWSAIRRKVILTFENFRSDNDVKNHFYSKIRKGLRKLNMIIKSDFKK